jgi:hypothetical protein
MKNMVKTILLGMLLFLLLTACSEKDSTGPDDNDNPNPPELAAFENFDEEFIFPDDVTGFTTTEIEIDGVMETAITLEQFVNFGEKEIADEETYLYQIFSTDEDGNFSARNKDYGDLTWAEFTQGYFLPEVSDGKTYFPNFVEENINAYNVKYAHYLRLFRKVDVVKAGTTTCFEVNGLPMEDISYIYNEEMLTVSATKMVNFISDYVTDKPEEFEYQFLATDDYEHSYSWENLQSAYWVPEKNRVVFIDAEGNQTLTNFKKLYSITLAEIARY